MAANAKKWRAPDIASRRRSGAGERARQQRAQHGLAGGQAVGGLGKDDRLRTVDDLGRDFFAPVRGQAVHEHGVIAGPCQQRRVDAIGREGAQTLCARLSKATRMDVVHV